MKLGRIKGRIGHIYPLEKLRAEHGGEGEAEDKEFEVEQGS